MPFEKPRWFNGVIGDPAKPSKKPKKKQLVAELESIRTSVGKQLLKLNSDRPRPSFQAAENEEGHDTDTSLQQLVGLLLEWYNEDLQELERCKEKAKDLEQKQRSGIEGDENEGGLRNSSVIKHPEDDQALKSAWLRGETEGKRVNQEEWQRYRDEVENIKIPQEYERGRGDGAKEEYDRWQTRYKALQAKFKQRQDDDLREIEEQQTTIKTLETGRNEEQRRYDEKMSNTNRQHLKNMEELREQHDKKLGQTLQDHATRMDTETRRYQNEVKRLQGLHDQQIAESQCEIETMQQDHKAHKTRIQQELEAKDESQRTQLTGLKQTHAAATKILKQHHEREIARMAAEHSHRVQRLEAANFAIKTQMGQEISDLKEKHTTELEALEQGYNQKVSHMKDAYATQVETMQTKHTEAQTHLREQVQSFSGALLTRDIRDFTMLEMEDLKALSDNDIRSRFELLKQDVDSFARLDWKPNPKHWTNQIVKRLSSNQRVLKKHILQDIIWTSLHAFIFCSPFRLFGEEGEALELQWNERCGKDGNYDNGTYIWPKPGMETERWRYATVAECRASLRKPLPSQWDPRAKLKKGFMSSMEDLRSELATVLGELIVMDKDTMQILERMTKRAANVWLEFAMQRCRILIVVSGSMMEPAGDKVKRALEGTLELVAAPILRRYGTSAGLDLILKATVGGFDGEKVGVPLS